ncbi:glycosyl hydrolase [Caldimonas brevitalea]|uniref:glucan endo-1,3-beta-D-glucosidase n=1 Tax=Caldimonas brevitalea TaxID=413882 RepID=A0A0G3BL35_9BURK|nr:glycosyl hydrolase [Caldimonas brevitalea]AKJ28081.1 hypothetical protein AAW51_1390 [Caldimonas brevitalea]
MDIRSGLKLCITAAGVAALTLQAAVAATVPVGAGSYTDTLPAGQKGPSNKAGVPVRPKVTADFTGPVQTNKWWSSLIWQFDPEDAPNPWSSPMFPHPLSVQAFQNGLGLSYKTTPALNNEYHYHYRAEDLRVGLAGLNSPDTRVAKYSDWSVVARWSGASSLDATITKGVPFVFFTRQGNADAQVNVTSGYQGTFYNQRGVLGIEVNGHYYLLCAPTGSNWSSGPPFTSSLSGKNYFTVALLPDKSPATIELYRKHAYAFITHTRAQWRYDEANAEMNTTFTFTTELKESGNGNLNYTLFGLYPHQWKNSADPVTPLRYVSPRGEMRVRAGNSMHTKMKFNGVLPTLPDAGSYDRSRLAAYVQDAYLNDTYISHTDTYWGGKDAGRLAQLVWIADQVGNKAARDNFIRALKLSLEDWMHADAGGDNRGLKLYYDRTWNTLIGYPASFNSNTELNDHDFHYGYWMMAAATVAHFDPGWAAQDKWGAMVEFWMRDVANMDRSDTRFPFMRSFDVYSGHDWANGPALFASGNNEESSSEAMNFATGVALWGAATGNKRLRDMGIFLHATMTRAIEQYWFDVDQNVFPASFQHDVVGIVWGSGAAYATWWTANPEEIHGINFLPITGGSLYLGRHPSYVKRNYDELVRRNGGPESEWVDVIWSFQALVDPAAALAKFGAGNYASEAGESKAHTYHWLHNLNAMGRVDTGVTANVPTHAVFNKNGVRTYVAYNPSGAARTVRFSNGACLRVQPKRIGHGAGTDPC